MTHNRVEIKITWKEKQRRQKKNESDKRNKLNKIILIRKHAHTKRKITKILGEKENSFSILYTYFCFFFFNFLLQVTFFLHVFIKIGCFTLFSFALNYFPFLFLLFSSNFVKFCFVSLGHVRFSMFSIS